jgi:hypothetical protein
MNYILSILKLLKPKTAEEIRDEYLAQSVDIADLEKRIRDLTRPKFVRYK